MVLDQLTLEWAGTQNFKGIAISNMCFEKSGTSASKWAMGKSSNFNIVRIKIVWIFFRCGHGKKLKTAFFHKTLIPRNLLKEKNIQDRTMWKRTSWRFQKCGTYWACQLLNGSYCCSKSKDCEILAPLAKIRSRKKKNHGRNFQFWALPLNQRGTNHDGPTLIQWQRSKLKITAVVFFFTAPCPVDFFLKFDQTLTSHNYGLKPRNLENYHIFGILRTCPFTWYHPR